jgi:hypothetical protein
MENNKVKILLENYISKNPDNSYGTITATSFNVNVFLTQEIKDIGKFLDYPYITFDANLPTLTYAPIPQKLNDYGGGNFTFITQPGANFYPTGTNFSDVRYKNKVVSNYYTNNIIVTGLTEDRLESVSSYGFTGNTKYVPGFDLKKGQYFNYAGASINGITRVISLNDLNPIIYTEDADLNDVNLGTILQGDGILFQTYSSLFRNQIDTYNGPGIPVTKMSYHGQGTNKTNSSLSALTIEEYLLHITETPKVQNELFIDRGATTVVQSHLQLGEISSLGDLINYGNGYYNILR